MSVLERVESNMNTLDRFEAIMVWFVLKQFPSWSSIVSIYFNTGSNRVDYGSMLDHADADMCRFDFMMDQFYMKLRRIWASFVDLKR